MLKKKVRPVINIEIIIAGTINLDVLIPKLFKANNSECEDNLPYVKRVESKTDIGNERTKNPGNFKNNILIANVNGNPNSTIFLIKSNITPTDKETTVKAEIEKIKGGINCSINHLSIRGINLRSELKFLKTELII